MLLATFLLTFGLLLAAILAAAIKLVFLPKRVNAFEPLVRGGAVGALIAVGAFAVLVRVGEDLESGFFGDLLQNGAALVSIGALAGTVLATLRTRASPPLARAQLGSK